MNTHLLAAARVLSSVWLVWAAFLCTVLAAIGIPRGPYLSALAFFALAALFLAGAIALWRFKRVHWLPALALVVSVGMAAYGRIHP